ncbi:dTDP-4-dehydrorhamnose reductase [Falsiroseomonas sp. CW058]|uniref:dTDP-4-dehydrorhamnose reductase n=1 Tax=Falsiroseomonas sp. CW058 TaxID=3388664 RepID=UPI003D31A629
MSAGRSVLVVGRSGQLAEALLPALRAAGFEAVAMGRPDLDLRDGDSVQAAVRRTRPALVVNAAAWTAVDRAEDEPWPAEALNAGGPAILADASRAWGAAMVQVSTDYVFDGRKGAPYTERDNPAPRSIYGASKLAGEYAVRQANPRSVVLRTSWLCSATGHNFLRTVLRLASEREELRVVADQLGAPTFADDLAVAIATMAPSLIAAEAGSTRFGVFHLAGAPHTSWHGFAEAILRGAAARGHRAPKLTAITTAEYPTPATRPADSRLDCTRIADVHGIAAPDWRVALDRALDTLVGPTLAPQPARQSKEGISA